MVLPTLKAPMLKAAMAVSLGAVALSAVSPAEARRNYRGYRDRDHTGTAIAVGVLGLAVGAAIASSSRDGNRYYNRGYEQPYPPTRYREYYPSRRYNGYDRDCITRKEYDPYLDRRVRVRYCR